MEGSVRTARMAGLFYVGLAMTGLLGFLIVRPRLFTPGDAESTLANLVENAALARAGIALEMGIVLTQALAATSFYRLFRPASPTAAGGIAAFGLVNAVAILCSAAALATAAQVAHEPFGDAAATVQTLYLMSGNLWGVGNLFFGLWLIPMGTCVLSSRWMPRALGWILIVGGAGYILSGFVNYLVPDAGAATEVLVVPATLGEFWMIGYLLTRGVRRIAGEAPGAVTVAASSVRASP